MKIAKTDNEHHLEFNDDEIKALVKTKKLTFSHIAMKRLVNVFADICAETMKKFPPELNHLHNEDDEIKLDE